MYVYASWCGKPVTMSVVKDMEDNSPIYSCSISPGIDLDVAWFENYGWMAYVSDDEYQRQKLAEFPTEDARLLYMVFEGADAFPLTPPRFERFDGATAAVFNVQSPRVKGVLIMPGQLVSGDPG